MLFIFRTYSVDSSESSSDENSDKDVREEVDELSKTLSDLVRENKELEVSFIWLVIAFLMRYQIPEHKTVLKTVRVLDFKSLSGNELTAHLSSMRTVTSPQDFQLPIISI